MARIFFAGIKHSGKTRMAGLVSELLTIDHADSDDLVSPLLGGQSVREFYREHGKAAFMEKEAEAAIAYCEEHNSYILSLGGGASDNLKLMEYIREHGKMIYLRRAERDMLPVILRDGIPPFLDAEDPEGSFHKLYIERDAKYMKAADLVIELGPYGDKGETARLILSSLRENGYV